MLRAWTLALVVLLTSATGAQAADYVVNDGGDAGDGTCDATCTLRDAIDDSNASGVDDEIRFAATPVEPTSALPSIVDTVTINGSDAPACAGVTGFVVLDGPGGFDGLHFAAGSAGSRICRANIRGFGDGIQIDADDVTVEQCRIGTNIVAESADPNGRGVYVNGASGALVTDSIISGNTTGGVILHEPASGVSTGNAITGNQIGTDLGGGDAIPNFVGVQISHDGIGVKVGGTAEADRNVISGNTQYGVFAVAGTVKGNFIGTDDEGDEALPNGSGAVSISGDGVVVGDDTASGRNVLAGDGLGFTVYVDADGTLQGNRIGVNAEGTAAFDPQDDAVTVADNGDGALIEDNVIAGHAGYGVGTQNGVDGLTIRENLIGVLPDGITVAAGDTGVDLAGGTSDVLVEANTIAGHTGAGIRAYDPAGAAIRGNGIHGNGLLGIDLEGDGVTENDAGGGDADTGANQLQNFPVLTKAETDGSATAVAGTIDTTPGRTITIEVFANDTCDASGNGEGKTFLGRSQVVAGTGPTAFSFSVGGTSAGKPIAATATDEGAGAGETSEFSDCFTATQPPAPVVISDPDPGVVFLDQTAPLPPTVAPPPISILPPPPVPKFPAKVAVLRNGVDDGVLDMLIQITSRAESPGAVLELDYQSSGKHTRFEVPITGTQIKVRKKLPKSQPKDTGIVEIAYAGNSEVSPDEVRLRAADGKSKLKRTKSAIEDGKLNVQGTIAEEAKGVVRIRLEYALPNGSTEFLYWNAKIANGKWKIAKTLPSAAAAGGQLSIQFTGYEKEDLRGEQIAKQVLA